MKVVVTGHKGYIGTVMVPMLEAAGHEVLGIDSDLYRNSTYGSYTPPANELLKDVRDIEPDDLRGADAVVHLAALSNDVLGDLNPENTYAINHRASVRLAEMARELGIRRYLFASSCSIYGAAGQAVLDETAQFAPVTPYAESKVYVERDVSALASDDFSPTYMRNATAYGVSPRIRFDVVMNNLCAWAYTTGQVRLKSDGSPWRPIVHIRDISTAVLAVLAAPRERVHNEAYNIGVQSENFQIRDIARIVHEAIPGSEITFAEGAAPDTRSYQVDFCKYTRQFPDHPLTWTAVAGARELYGEYRRLGLDKDAYEGPRYKRIGQLKQLLADGQLDDTLRFRS